METSDLLYLTSDLVPTPCYKCVKQFISPGISESSHHCLFNIILKSDLLRALNIFNDGHLII